MQPSWKYTHSQAQTWAPIYEWSLTTGKDAKCDLTLDRSGENQQLIVFLQKCDTHMV